MTKTVKVNIIIILCTLPLFVMACVHSANMRQAAPNLSSYGTTRTNGLNKFPSIIRLNNQDGSFFCSGVVIDGQYALTAAHCVSGTLGGMKTDSLLIADAYGNMQTTAVPVAVDQYLDVAFIKGDFKDFTAAPVDFKGEQSKYGMNLLACGFPAGAFTMYCAQLIHVGNMDFRYRTVGGPIYKGMSGGPVIEITSGKVVGVNSAVDTANVIISPIIGSLESVGIQ